MSKILIVDDNVNICHLLKSFLEEMDHHIIVSYNGVDAQEKVKKLKPDVMLLDMTMEGIGGMEVLNRIRLFDKRIVIIMISGLIDKALCKKALENGANEYITKPFDFDYLHKCIVNNLIKRNRKQTE